MNSFRFIQTKVHKKNCVVSCEFSVFCARLTFFLDLVHYVIIKPYFTYSFHYTSNKVVLPELYTFFFVFCLKICYSQWFVRGNVQLLPYFLVPTCRAKSGYMRFNFKLLQHRKKRRLLRTHAGQH